MVLTYPETIPSAVQFPATTESPRRAAAPDVPTYNGYVVNWVLSSSSSSQVNIPQTGKDMSKTTGARGLGTGTVISINTLLFLFTIHIVIDNVDSVVVGILVNMGPHKLDYHII